jgi:hypothetical protein
MRAMIVGMHAGVNEHGKPVVVLDMQTEDLTPSEFSQVLSLVGKRDSFILDVEVRE